MASADKMFTLDPVQTSLSDTETTVAAQRSVNTAARDAGLVQSMGGFSDALRNLTNYKIQERVREDIIIAENAAVREKVMPGGLTPRAQQAFRDTQDLVTSNKVKNEITVLLEGDGVQNLVKDPILSSEGKIRQLKGLLNNYYVDAAKSIQNPKTLLELKANIDLETTKSMEGIYDVEKKLAYGVTLEGINGQIKKAMDTSEIDPRDGVTLEGINGQIKKVFDTEIDPRDVLNGKWLQTVAKQAQENHPWLIQNPDETKLAVFSMLTQNEDMLMHPDVIDILMKTEFSKGVTWEGLANGTTETGQEIRKMYIAYQTAVETNLDEMDKAEIDAQTYLDSQAVDAMEEWYEQHKDDPDRNLEAIRLLKEQYGASPSTRLSIIRGFNTEEGFTKHNVDSMAYSDTEDAVIDGVINNPRDLIDWVANENLDNESYTRLSRLLTDRNTREYRFITEFKDSVKTTTSTVISSLKGLVRSETFNEMISAMINQNKHFSDEAIRTVALTNKSTLQVNEFTQVMVQLQTFYDQFNKEARAEAELAVRENRERPNIYPIQSKFQQDIANFIAQVKLNKGPVPYGEEDVKSFTGGEDKGTTPPPPEKTSPSSGADNSKELKQSTISAATGTSDSVKELAGSLGDSVTFRERTGLSEIRSKEEQDVLENLKNSLKKIEPKELKKEEVIGLYESVLSPTSRSKLMAENPESKRLILNDREQRETNLWNQFTEFLFPESKPTQRKSVKSKPLIKTPDVKNPETTEVTNIESEASKGEDLFKQMTSEEMYHLELSPVDLQDNKAFPDKFIKDKESELMDKWPRSKAEDKMIDKLRKELENRGIAVG